MDSPVRSKSGLSHKLNLFIARRHNSQDRHWEFSSPMPALLSAPRTGVILVLWAQAESCSAWDRTQECFTPRGCKGTPEIPYSTYSWNDKFPTRYLIRWGIFSNLEVKWEPVTVRSNLPASAQEQSWTQWIPSWIQIPQEEGWILPTCWHLQDLSSKLFPKNAFQPSSFGWIGENVVGSSLQS